MDIEQEKQLVDQAKESLQAFDQLYEHYLPKIYAYVLNRVANPEIAEDLTSKTFVKAMTKLQDFEYRGFTFGAWLYRIAHNNIIDHFRKNKSKKVDLDFVKETIGTEGDERQIERQMIILEALSKLSAEHQEMLSLKFFEGFSNEELADLLGCSSNNATVRLHRAKKSFEKALNKMGYKEII